MATLPPRRAACSKSGAGKRVRTVDLNLGKVALYQLSYSRMVPVHYILALRGPKAHWPPSLSLVQVRPRELQVIQHRIRGQHGGQVDQRGAERPQVDDPEQGVVE